MPTMLQLQKQIQNAAMALQKAIDRQIVRNFSILEGLILDEIDDKFRKFSNPETGRLSLDDLGRPTSIKIGDKVIRTTQIEVLQRKIDEIVVKELLRNDNFLKTAMGMTYREGYYRQAWAISQEARLNLNFGILNPNVVEAAVFAPISKLSDSILLANDRKATARRIDTTIRSALAQVREDIKLGIVKGETFRGIARKIARTLGMDPRSNNVVVNRRGEVYKAIRVARTEGHAIYTNAQIRSYDKAGDLGVKVRRRLTATIDGVTREQSIIDNGKFADEEGFFHYSNGEVVRSPGDIVDPAIRINDREIVVPIVEDFEPKLRRQRDPRDKRNKLVPFQSWSKWSENQKVAADINKHAPKSLQT